MTTRTRTGPRKKVRTIAPEPQELLCRVQIPAATRYLSEARASVSAAITRLQLPSDFLGDMVLAFGEASTNAVKYSKPGKFARIDIVCYLDKSRNNAGRSLVIEISNQGTGFQPEPESSAFKMPPPAKMATHGRGLPIIGMLTDGVEYLADNSTTTVRLIKHLP